MTVRLHIERLVVDGLEVAPVEVGRFQAALEAGLSERVGEGDAPWTSGAVPALPSAGLTLAHGASPEAIGDQIAALLYERLRQ